MSGIGVWGTGSWGTGSWGAVPAPALAVVSPGLADVKGGTVVGLFGTNFFDPMLVELLDGGGITVVGRAYYFEARLDLRAGKALVGLPPLPVGSYGLRLTTPAGVSPIVPNAVTYAVFAEQTKVQRARRQWSSAWATGPRILG